MMTVIFISTNKGDRHSTVTGVISCVLVFIVFHRQFCNKFGIPLLGCYSWLLIPMLIAVKEVVSVISFVGVAPVSRSSMRYD